MDRDRLFNAAFRAGAGSGLSRRRMLGLGCACCAAALLRPADLMAAPVAPVAERPIHRSLDEAARAIEQRMIAWRRDIHQNPELGNQETRTAKLVADHLRALGYEVTEGVAVTGVVGVLRGGAGEGPVVALRADMDALPVTEAVDLPFASKVRATFGGQEVGVMHACGHDCHVAILMAAAEVLAQHRDQLKGTVKLLFQPAEEGLPDGVIGGARLMVDEGVMDDPKPDAVFGLHVGSSLAAGQLRYMPGVVSAGSDTFSLVVTGRQTHGARPWSGVDPITAASEIVGALQTLVSRETNIVESPAVLTIGTIRGGTRYNIVPDQVEMTGTLRTYSEETRTALKQRVTEMAAKLAEGMRATAETTWQPNGYPSIVADAALVERMAPTLSRVAGDGLAVGTKTSTSEDFSYFAQRAPGMFFNIGIATPGTEDKAASNHSPHFQVDESGLLLGLRSMVSIVADFTGSGVA